MQSLFCEVSKEEFFQTYWQKRPLLIKNAFPSFKNPLSPKKTFELAKLPQVHSRLILGENEDLELYQGPFETDDFKTLDDTPWTLLLNEMDTHDEKLHEILRNFLFLPNWRVDDIMVSHSSKGGSVGAHVDSYDVFLLQAQGRKKWQIGKAPFEGDSIENESGLKLIPTLEDFEEYILEPGDILYLPPRRAHHGESLDDDGMTFSIGMMAPSLEDLNMVYLSELGLDEEREKTYLRDPDLSPRKNSSEILSFDLKNALNQMKEQLMDESIFIKSFGKVITENKREVLLEDDEDRFSEEELTKKIKDGLVLRAHPRLRLAFFKDKEQIHFFANGEHYDLPLESLDLINHLSNKRSLKGEVMEDLRHLVYDLYERGLLIHL